MNPQRSPPPPSRGQVIFSLMIWKILAGGNLTRDHRVTTDCDDHTRRQMNKAKSQISICLQPCVCVFPLKRLLFHQRGKKKMEIYAAGTNWGTCWAPFFFFTSHQTAVDYCTALCTVGGCPASWHLKLVDMQIKTVHVQPHGSMLT